MVPVCYPSKISSTTGLREAVVFALPSVTGLVRWTDYIPVKLVASADAALEGRTDAGGFIPMDMLSSNTGLMGWVDYLPVYVDNSATDAWAITATGFIPYAASGGGSSPAFTVTMTALSNALGTVTTMAYINPGSGSLITPATLSVGSGSVSRISGVAPLSVFFDASATTAVSRTSKPFHELEYKWTYGDPAGGATWTYGARTGLSKNVSYGPMGSHVFETPGIYVVTLDVRDIDSSGIADNAPAQTITITVDDPDVIFSGTNTIVFATDGVFTGKPTGAQEVTTSNYDTAINTYKGTGKRLLFKKGQTFTATAPAVLNVDGPGIVGAWGSGAIPKFNTTNTDGMIYLSNRSTPGINDWRIMDIELDGQDGSALGIVGEGGIDQVLLLRMNIHNVDTGITLSEDLLNAHNSNPSYDGHTLWDQFAVVDSQIGTINSGVASGGMIGIYVSATQHTVMGCLIDVNGGGEHCMRHPYVHRGVVSHNLMQNPPANKHCWTLRGADQAQTTALVGLGMATQKVVASENTFYNVLGAWSVTVAPQNADTDERIQDVILERNYWLAGGTAVEYALLTAGPTQRLTVRNNIFNMTGSASWSGGIVANGGSNVIPTPPASTGHAFYNNTLYRSDSTSEIAFILLGSNANTYEVKNNLVYAPSAGGTIVFISGAIDSGLSTGGNTSDAQIKNNNPLFSTIPTTAKQLVSTDFKITSTSYAIDSGVYVPVFDDATTTTRSGTYDKGAVLP